MILGLAADVNKRKTEKVGYQCSLGNGARGNPCNCIYFGEILEDYTGQLQLDEAAKFRIRKRFAIVAIERALESARPSEWVGRRLP